MRELMNHLIAGLYRRMEKLGELAFSLGATIAEISNVQQRRFDEIDARLAELCTFEGRVVQHVMRAEAHMSVGLRERDQALRAERDRVLQVVINELTCRMSDRDRARIVDRLVGVAKTAIA